MSRAGAALSRATRRQEHKAQDREDARRRRLAERRSAEVAQHTWGPLPITEGMLGCEHGRLPGQPCPHCLGFSVGGWAGLAERTSAILGTDRPDAPVLCIPPAGTDDDLFLLAHHVAGRLGRAVVVVGTKDGDRVQMPRPRLTWEQATPTHWDARWGAEPLRIRLSVWHDDRPPAEHHPAAEAYSPSASIRTPHYDFFERRDVGCEVVLWCPDGVATLAEAQAACEAWLEDWLRRSTEGRP